MTINPRPARRLPQLILAALVLLASLGAARTAGAQTAGGAPPSPDQKISSALAAAVAGLPGPGLASADAAPLRDGPVATFNGLIQIVAVTTPAQIEAARSAITAVGGEDIASGPGDLSLQAWVPTGALAALAADPAVLALRLPDILSPVEEGSEAADGPALQLGAALSEGVAAMGAGAWHSQSVTGRGIKVGVIDSQFGGAAALLGTELPQSTVWKSFIDKETEPYTGGSTFGHGTSCAVIIADVAPGAQLFLAAVATPADMLEAVNWMAGQGVKVISMSMGDYIGAPGDGTGEYATIINAARDKGMLMVVAAGNQRRFHWNGGFADTDGDQLLDFAPGVEHNCLRYEAAAGCSALPKPPAGTFEPQLEVQMRWADSWTAPATNLSLYLYRRSAGGSWVQVAKSEDSQSGAAGQRPTEHLRYTLAETASSTPYEFAIGIKKVSGAAPTNIDLFVKVNNSLTLFNDMTLRYRTVGRSLSVIGAVGSALTVGALDVATLAQAPYSGEGPTNGAGDTTSKPGLVKPDLMGYANVSTGSPSGKRFEGTSAATPHVAAAAALVAQLMPNARPVHISGYLTQSAKDLGQAGKDSVFGAGQLRLQKIPAPNPYDSNRDGRADIFWRDYTYGNNSLLPISEQGLAPGGAAMPNVADVGWRVVGRGDLNGDGLADVVWRHTISGGTTVWLMKLNGATPARESSLHLGYVPTSWRIMDLADFNADGKADLLWQHSTGKASVWLMNGAAVSLKIDLPAVPAGHIVYAADFNADRRSDVLLRNPSTGSNLIWLFDGAKVAATGAIKTLQSSYITLVGAADLDDNARADLVWELSDGTIWVWFASGTQVIKEAPIGRLASGFKLAGLADVNGDLMADLIVRKTDGSATAAVLVNGTKPFSWSPFSNTTLSAVGIPGPAQARWTIAGMAAYTASAAPAGVAEPDTGDLSDPDLSQAGALWPTEGPGALPALEQGADPAAVLSKEPPSPLPAEAGATIYLPLLVR